MTIAVFFNIFCYLVSHLGEFLYQICCEEQKEHVQKAQAAVEINHANVNHSLYRVVQQPPVVTKPEHFYVYVSGFVYQLSLYQHATVSQRSCFEKWSKKKKTGGNWKSIRVSA